MWLHLARLIIFLFVVSSLSWRLLLRSEPCNTSRFAAAAGAEAACRYLFAFLFAALLLLLLLLLLSSRGFSARLAINTHTRPTDNDHRRFAPFSPPLHSSNPPEMSPRSSMNRLITKPTNIGSLLVFSSFTKRRKFHQKMMNESKRILEAKLRSSEFTTHTHTHTKIDRCAPL